MIWLKSLEKKQVLQWRRSYDITPPKLKESNENHPKNDTKYSHLDDSIIPSAESLKDVVKRLLPLWNKIILNELKLGKRVLIVAHGNSLRAIYKVFNKINHNDILKFNIPTGIPLVFELDKNLKPKKDYYLGNQENI